MIIRRQIYENLARDKFENESADKIGTNDENIVKYYKLL